MNRQTELEWLAERRPDPGHPAQASTDRARAALLGRAVRERRHRRRARAGAFALGGALAAGVVLALVATDGGGQGRGRSHERIAVAPDGATHLSRPSAARSTPLVRLAADVRRLPARRQRGDATLVVRYTLLNGHHAIDGAVYGGYDLYTDSGRYYYAPDSLTQLQQIVAGREAVEDSGNEARALRTIAAAAAGSPAQARAAILSTEPHDGRPESISRAGLRRLLRSMPARLRRAARRLEALDAHPDVRAHEDSLVWLDATQALAVGAGRPNVRAACIKALETLRGVHETSTRVDGISALRVGFPDGPVPVTVWLDARNGEPIQERDGGDSTTTYAVERVNAAHLPTRVSMRAILR